ncbi:MAG TPA: transglutaminase family protein [Planctomycetota bacterium]|nr:transglutaminase family protein [Planctomycetota bacterium]
MRTSLRLVGAAFVGLLLSGPAWTGEIAEPPVLVAPQPDAAKTSLFDQVLELNRVQEPDLDAVAAHEALQKLIVRLRPQLAAAKSPEEKIAVLNTVLLADRKVEYLSNLYWRDATLAAGLLRGKGNCLSLSTLYVVIGDELKLPICMVVMPGHAFARWDDGKTQINIETTARGVSISDEEYRTRTEAGPEDSALLGWGKSLTRDEFLAELTQTAAMHRRGENKLTEAMQLLEQAEKLAPGRSDRTLMRLQLMADLTGKRSEARQQVVNLVRGRGTLPPTVKTGALTFLAHDAAGSGDHQRERQFLMMAFAEAPKSSQSGVLQELAFCLRALKDYRGAVRTMELAAALMKPGDPNNATVLYNLAILQKNDQRLDDALVSIRAALKINPESWNLQVIEAGYMVLNGEKEAGQKKFEAVERPHGDVDFFEVMQTWFFAVSHQREKFYTQFEKALSTSHSTHILEWIDQDVDLDVYRAEPEFKALVEKYAPKLRGH